MRGIEQIPWMYDALCALLERAGMRRWRDWVTGGARGRTLEVGCGTGRNLSCYPGGAALVAVDPDGHMLRKARERAPGVPLVRASAEALPFKDGAFDTVVSALVFCSVADPAAGLGEIRRVLGPGGRLRMLEHGRSDVPWRARWQDRIQPLWTRLAGGCHPNRETERIVEAAGFRIDPQTRRAKGTMRRFVADPAAPAPK